jgi:hypothetical protein
MERESIIDGINFKTDITSSRVRRLSLILSERLLNFAESSGFPAMGEHTGRLFVPQVDYLSMLLLK